MSQQQSTESPGPWETRTYPHLTSIEIRSPFRWWPIARVKKNGQGRGPDSISQREAEANARLLASAPSIAKELAKLKRYLHNYCDSPAGDCSKCGNYIHTRMVCAECGFDNSK